MIKKILVLLLLVCVLSLSLGMPVMVHAQETAYVVDTTMPVDTDVRDAVDDWLSVSPPVAELPYYAITYVHAQGADTFVSLAALDITNPSDPWNMTTGDTVAWVGSVIVYENLSVEMFSTHVEGMSPGGGSDLRFPWAIGSKLMYGIAGVHAAGGGGAYAEGFLAVDFLGGSDLGSGVASDKVYAAFDGVVDYVCADDTTTLVRTVDEETDNYFIYAHLLSNGNLVENQVFKQGDLIGSVKHGNFSDNCGYAEQQEYHYHLHFGFEAAGDAFRMEDCILNISSEEWTCGSKKVKPGEYLMAHGGDDGGGGGGGGGGGDEGTADNTPSFFDMITVGIVSMWTEIVINKLPPHQAMELTYVIYTTVELMLRIAYVLVYSNVNLGHLVVAVLAGFAIKLLLGLVEMIVFIFKAWKSLVPIWGA